MNEEFENGLAEKEKVEVKKPKKYNVILLNDDYTPFDFVIEVLMKVFNHSLQSANQIATDIHQKDKGICGTYIKSIAEAKSKRVNILSKQNQFVLKSIVEEA